MDPKDFKYNVDMPKFDAVPGNVICKECLRRAEDHPGSPGWTKGICKAFPKLKPVDILMGRTNQCVHNVTED